MNFNVIPCEGSVLNLSHINKLKLVLFSAVRLLQIFGQSEGLQAG